jgi:glucose-6-phosphate isomerase
VNQILDSIEKKESAYQIFSIDHARAQNKEAANISQEIKDNFSDFVVIGMGGSVLNPRTLVSLARKKSSTKIHFLDNTDPIFLKALLSGLDLQNTAVLVISNSGNTLETVSLAAILIAEFEKIGIKNLGKHFYFITNPNAGILKDVALNIGAKLIAHTDNISGRYSGMTNVGSLVANVAGIDFEEYLSGAEAQLQEFTSKKEVSQAALSAGMVFNEQKSISVNLGYLQNFAVFLEWYSQIIAESLGKNGKGITPIRGLGPNDQHSMLQLYLDGPRDKLYSLFYAKKMQSDLITDRSDSFDYMANKNLADINKANFDATLKALAGRGQPTRSIIIDDLSASSIGALVMHSMLEVINLGHMMKINPFNQPGVEKIKVEAKKALIK